MIGEFFERRRTRPSFDPECNMALSLLLFAPEIERLETEPVDEYVEEASHDVA